MSHGHAVLKFMRKVHLYLGIFTTPALLFFAFSGAMQTFSLHETTEGSTYKPPAWIVTLAQLHKKQDMNVPVHKLRAATTENGEHGDGDAEDRRHAAEGPGHALKEAGSGSAQPTALSKAGESGASAQKSHLPMKVFFVLVAISLAFSTLTGVYMSYKYHRGWWQLTGLLVAGLVVPLLLLAF